MFEEFSQLQQTLKQARSLADQAEWRMGLMPQGVPEGLFNDLNVVKRENAFLAMKLAEYQSRTGTGSGNLGFLLAFGIGAAATGLVALTGWIWKNRAQAEDLEAKTSLYHSMRNEGVDPERAASLILGQKSSVSDMLDKITVLSVLGVGAYALLKIMK